MKSINKLFWIVMGLMCFNPISALQLGDGTNIDRKTPVQVMDQVEAASAGGDHTLVLKVDHTLWAFGTDDFGQHRCTY